MKVEKAVGWIQGLNGTGIVYELSHNGEYLLATIWQDGKFHFLDRGTLTEHIGQGKGALTDPRSSYLAANAIATGPDGTLEVSNPAGWQRLYIPPTGNGPQPGTDELVFPVELSFTGSLKIKVAGLSEILKFVE